MIELTLIIIFFALYTFPNPWTIQAIILVLIVLYCIRAKNLRGTALFVLILILKSASNQIEIITIYQSIHAELYLSFNGFITNFFPNNIVVFLISITIGTSEVKLQKSTYDIFKQFNLLHVVSISGANFTLIKDLFEFFKKYINKNIVNIFILGIQTYYILLIGLFNLAAMRAYLFMLIGTYSTIVGRPIKFVNKLLITLVVIICLNPNSLSSKNLWLSIGFSILYKLLELKPLSIIFNNELKKLALIFIISAAIFNSDSPDFIANLVFGLIYPIIFISTFLAYILSYINIQFEFLVSLIELLIRIIFDSLNQLSSYANGFLQIAIFIAILISTLKSISSRRNHEYTKFAQ